MILPILKSTSSATDADLVRFASQVNLEWSRHLAIETPLDFGRAFTAPDLPTVYDANCILDTTVPAGYSPQDVFDQVTTHFQSKNATCHKWWLNAAPDSAALADLLISKSFRKTTEHVRHLPHLPRINTTEIPGLKIIPARASFKHYRALAEEEAKHWNTPQCADAAMLHLDDGHYDALLALKDGFAAGCIGVLAVGEIGAIQGLYVSEKFRRQGIARALMHRALEICLRSLFRHVLLTVQPDNHAANQLYDQFGFHTVGELASYLAANTTPPSYPRP